MKRLLRIGKKSLEPAETADNAPQAEAIAEKGARRSRSSRTATGLVSARKGKDARPAPVDPPATTRAKKAADVLAIAKRLKAQRPKDHLSSILAELRELNISRRDPGRFYQAKDIVSAIGENILGSAKKRLGDDLYFPDVQNESYSLGHVSPIRYLARLIRPDTTAVMELGSGWSSNLLQLYIAHGTTRSKKIIYYGGEDTREGQICAKLLAGFDPGLAYRSFQFDFDKPNIEFLQRQRGHILLFTSHAIEHAEVLNPALFEQLKAISNPVTVVHFEPVGWQRDADLVKARDRKDAVLFEKLGVRALAGDLTSLSENAAWWSWRCNYNVNLLGLIQGMKRQKSIKISRLEYDVDGSGNVFNPTSLIHYDFIR